MTEHKFKIGERVAHRAKHADRMRGTVVAHGEPNDYFAAPGAVFVKVDKTGHTGAYMQGELMREGSKGIKST